MPDVTVTVQSLSAGLRRTFQAVRRPVMDAANRYGAVRESMATIAPRVIGLYNSIKNENARFSFADFARLFDPSVPMGSTEYRKHKVYYTLQYMQRIVTLGGRVRNTGVRPSATEALARTIATLIKAGVEPDAVFTAVKTEFGYTDPVMKRLRRRVEATQPLFNITIPRAGVIRVGNVIHMEPVAATVPAAAVEAPAVRRRRAA